MSTPNKEERDRMVDDAIKALYKEDSAFVKTPKGDLFKEVEQKSMVAVNRVRPLLKTVYETARDTGRLWKSGGKGELLAHATQLFLTEFGNRSEYSHEDLVWLVAVLHADLCVKQLM